MIRGAVYPIDVGDAKQRGKLLGLVLSLQRDGWSTVTVLPTSTRARESIFRPALEVAGQQTVVMIDQIRTIDTRFVVGEMVDFIVGGDRERVEYALARYLGLPLL
ncbi:type II toxin-antitoxin system PemK/MazF family toxin [Natronoglycomyces albus]|uniref:Type II toxin-antitoxin system PemK/MazF family toxin n=2 Tax=Natronoglycomyces albus TaxID=2811108 RepID=A0A895XTY4_9ACTN|nr:type II toxin-antitoxin system PemK/MazF family toxin [Natronoglycomyces albus]